MKIRIAQKTSEKRYCPYSQKASAFSKVQKRNTPSGKPNIYLSSHHLKSKEKEEEEDLPSSWELSKDTLNSSSLKCDTHHKGKNISCCFPLYKAEIDISDGTEYQVETNSEKDIHESSLLMQSNSWKEKISGSKKNISRSMIESEEMIESDFESDSEAMLESDFESKSEDRDTLHSSCLKFDIHHKGKNISSCFTLYTSEIESSDCDKNDIEISPTTFQKEYVDNNSETGIHESELWKERISGSKKNISRSMIEPEENIESDFDRKSEEMSVSEKSIESNFDRKSEEMIVSEKSIESDFDSKSEEMIVSEKSVESDLDRTPEEMIVSEKSVESDLDRTPEEMIVSEKSVESDLDRTPEEMIVSEKSVESDLDRTPEEMIVSEKRVESDLDRTPEEMIVSEKSVESDLDRTPEEMIVSEKSVESDLDRTPEEMIVSEKSVESDLDRTPEEIIESNLDAHSPSFSFENRKSMYTDREISIFEERNIKNPIQLNVDMTIFSVYIIFFNTKIPLRFKKIIDQLDSFLISDIRDDTINKFLLNIPLSFRCYFSELLKITLKKIIEHIDPKENKKIYSTIRYLQIMQIMSSDNIQCIEECLNTIHSKFSIPYLRLQWLVHTGARIQEVVMAQNNQIDMQENVWTSIDKIKYPISPYMKYILKACDDFFISENKEKRDFIFYSKEVKDLTLLVTERAHTLDQNAKSIFPNFSFQSLFEYKVQLETKQGTDAWLNFMQKFIEERPKLINLCIKTQDNAKKKVDEDLKIQEPFSKIPCRETEILDISLDKIFSKLYKEFIADLSSPEENMIFSQILMGLQSIHLKDVNIKIFDQQTLNKLLEYLNYNYPYSMIPTLSLTDKLLELLKKYLTNQTIPKEIIEKVRPIAIEHKSNIDRFMRAFFQTASNKNMLPEDILILNISVFCICDPEDLRILKKSDINFKNQTFTLYCRSIKSYETFPLTDRLMVEIQKQPSYQNMDEIFVFPQNHELHMKKSNLYQAVHYTFSFNTLKKLYQHIFIRTKEGLMGITSEQSELEQKRILLKNWENWISSYIINKP